MRDISDPGKGNEAGGGQLDHAGPGAVVDEPALMRVARSFGRTGLVEVKDCKPSRSQYVCRDVSGQPGKVDGECDGVC